MKNVTLDYPGDWESCDMKTLEKLAQDGSYGQRMIARRWLIIRARESSEAAADVIRRKLKEMGPP